MSGERARTVAKIGLTALATCAGLAAAGCADFSRVMSLKPEGVDPSSPVAAEVRAASQRDYKTPRFRDVPPSPADVRPAAAFGQAARASEAQRDQLNTWVAANPPMIPTDSARTEAFAESARARIPADQRVATPPAAGSEEYAARLRELATPPPPPR
jgi:hypothetical protein